MASVINDLTVTESMLLLDHMLRSLRYYARKIEAIDYGRTIRLTLYPVRYLWLRCVVEEDYDKVMEIGIVEWVERYFKSREVLFRKFSPDD